MKCQTIYCIKWGTFSYQFIWRLIIWGEMTKLKMYGCTMSTEADGESTFNTASLWYENNKQLMF